MERDQIFVTVGLILACILMGVMLGVTIERIRAREDYVYLRRVMETIKESDVKP